MVVAKKRGSFSTTTPSAQMKYRPTVETGRWASKGTIPLPDPVTVPEILTKVLVHGCKRVLHVDPRIRMIAYAILLFFVSLIADYVPFPRTYFSYSSNIPNQYFVKLSWAWTFSFVGVFMFLTSSVYCCGNRQLITRHFSRLAIGTIIWFIWTNLFRVIEESTGQCMYPPSGSSAPDILYSKGRKPCLKSGGKWTSFDISGHCFLLLWCSMFIIEESKAILGWDSIKDFIRNEDYKRNRPNTQQDASSGLEMLSDTPLSNLSTEEFESLKALYSKYGGLAKVAFIGLTLLTILWDLMIIMTACYFHVMIEKVLGGLIAASMWFITYRGIYTMNSDLSPGLPGLGLFKYSSHQKGFSSGRACTNVSKGGPGLAKLKLKESPDDVPKFMGMPLYAARKKPETLLDAAASASTSILSTKLN